MKKLLAVAVFLLPAVAVAQSRVLRLEEPVVIEAALSRQPEPSYEVTPQRIDAVQDRAQEQIAASQARVAELDAQIERVRQAREQLDAQAQREAQAGVRYNELAPQLAADLDTQAQALEEMREQLAQERAQMADGAAALRRQHARLQHERQVQSREVRAGIEAGASAAGSSRGGMIGPVVGGTFSAGTVQGGETPVELGFDASLRGGPMQDPATGAGGGLLRGRVRGRVHLDLEGQGGPVRSGTRGLAIGTTSETEFTLRGGQQESASQLIGGCLAYLSARQTGVRVADRQQLLGCGLIGLSVGSGGTSVEAGTSFEGVRLADVLDIDGRTTMLYSPETAAVGLRQLINAAVSLNLFNNPGDIADLQAFVSVELTDLNLGNGVRDVAGSVIGGVRTQLGVNGTERLPEVAADGSIVDDAR